MRAPAGHEVKAGTLYGAFRTWAVEGIEDVPSQRSFGVSMTAAGFERRTSNGTWYQGLALRDRHDSEP